MKNEPAVVKILGQDSLFAIQNDTMPQESEIFSYGKSGIGSLDITVSYAGSYLKTIDCPYSTNLVEMDMHLPNPEDLDIEETKYAHFLPPEGVEDNYCGDFQIAYTKNEMDIILSSNMNPTSFCKNGRVEYYFNDEDELLYIRVKDLTPEEYEVLKSQKKKNDTLDSSLKEKIRKIEEQEGVNAIFSTLIGSKGWGYEDENSDTDIRFIYVRPPEDYISLKKPSDNITYPIENGDDIVGYDLGKFLQLICSQNPVAYEIIHSPTSITDSPYAKQIRELSDNAFDAPRMVHIYQSLVENRISELQTKQDKNLKLLIYVLRMLATINYIQKNNQFPVTSMETLLEDESNAELKPVLEQLIAYKQAGNKQVKVTPELIEYTKQVLEKTKTVKMDSANANDPYGISKEASRIYYTAAESVIRKQEMGKIQFDENQEIKTEDKYNK